ncbi:hypothetical protein [uncultured Deefgea sp.]|uniref:hypothetical protein n=1 Tax=uncultured Deefgea sp. TaxID=1304914 RepID=UPI002593A0F3|nr:hypothetical protein [uncultured Deefgea sp.]
MLTIKKLLEVIVEYNDLPKFQVERAISTILTFYIEQILSDDGNELELISPEYPLRKENNQSTNVDYLLINKTKESIVLVEFKTNYREKTKSVLSHQNVYETIVEKIKGETASFLIDDVRTIRKKSTEKDKYTYLLKKAERINGSVREAEIIYLVPRAIKSKINEAIKNKRQKELVSTRIIAFDEICASNDNNDVYNELINALRMLK